MIEVSNIVVTEGSVTEPVTLAEVKAWLLVDHTDHDTLLTSMIKGARQSLENYLNLALVVKDVALDAENMSDDQTYFPFPYAKAVNTVVVGSLDSEDTEEVLTEGDDYYLRGNTLRINSGRHSVSYTIDPGTISQDLKEAIMMEVAERYRARGENNQEGKAGLSEAAIQKANPHQKVWL